MELVANIILDTLQIIKFLIIGELFYGFERKTGYWRYIVDGIILIPSSIIVYLFRGSTIATISYLICIIAIFLVMYNEKWSKLAVISVWLSMCISMIDLISAVLVGVLFKMTSMGKNDMEAFCISIITIIFLIIAGILLKRKRPIGLKNIKNSYMIVFSILLVFDSWILVKFSSTVMETLEQNKHTAAGYVFIGIIIGMLVQLISVLLLLISRDSYKEKDAIMQKYLNEQKEHYEYLEVREYETKKFRHDIRNHMHVIGLLAEKGSIPKIQEYLCEMNGRIENFGNKVSVNNGIVDAIINKYMDEAEKNQVNLKVEGHLPSECKISAFDICTIFSNLLSNACEAAKNSEQRGIIMNCYYTKEEIIATIENDYSGQITIEKGKIQTKKKDKNYHGMGLENVKECVKRNGGRMLIEAKQGKFKVTILLKNDVEKQ